MIESDVINNIWIIVFFLEDFLMNFFEIFWKKFGESVPFYFFFFIYFLIESVKFIFLCNDNLWTNRYKIIFNIKCNYFLYNYENTIILILYLLIVLLLQIDLLMPLFIMPKKRLFSSLFSFVDLSSWFIQFV